MQVSEVKEGETLILVLEGRLDSTTSADFEKQIVDAIHNNEKHIVIDLAGVDYISSAGLRAVLIGAKQMNAGYGKIALCGLSEKLQEVFHMSGFDKILTILPTRGEAVAAVAA
jgi:anti-anti-sigma factor